MMTYMIKGNDTVKKKVGNKEQKATSKDGYQDLGSIPLPVLHYPQ